MKQSTTVSGDALRNDNAECAALLYTLGFSLIEGTPAALSGDAVQGAPVFFRFAPVHPVLNFRQVMTAPLDYEQHAGPQRLIAVAFANLRALQSAAADAVQIHPCPLPGGLYILSTAAPVVRHTGGRAQLLEMMESRAFFLAASLATLGAVPSLDDLGTGLSVADRGGVRWYLPRQTAAGASVRGIIDRWMDGDACGQDSAQDNPAWLRVAFDNLEAFRRMSRSARQWVRVQNGRRFCLLPGGVSDDIIRRADRFLYR